MTVALSEACKTDRDAALARMRVLVGIVHEQRALLATAWRANLSIQRVTGARWAIDSARQEITALRRRWGFHGEFQRDPLEAEPT